MKPYRHRGWHSIFHLILMSPYCPYDQQLHGIFLTLHFRSPLEVPESPTLSPLSPLSAFPLISSCYSLLTTTSSGSQLTMAVNIVFFLTKTCIYYGRIPPLSISLSSLFLHIRLHCSQSDGVNSPLSYLYQWNIKPQSNGVLTKFLPHYVKSPFPFILSYQPQTYSLTCLNIDYTSYICMIFIMIFLCKIHTLCLSIRISLL